jgi:hypothetical protein
VHWQYSPFHRFETCLHDGRIVSSAVSDSHLPNAIPLSFVPLTIGNHQIMELGGEFEGGWPDIPNGGRDLWGFQTTNSTTPSFPLTCNAPEV